MAHNFAIEIQLDCPKCNHHFTVDVWLIVDIAERPDLLEKIKSGTLHDFPCPHCGYQGQVDMPLLIFRPDQEPHILFSPVRGTSQEEDQQQAKALVDQLKESLGDGWQDEWLKDGVPGAQRQMLPAILSEDPEVAMRDLAEKQARELEKLKADNPDEYLKTLLNAWLGAQNLKQNRQILESTPELLSPQAEDLLKVELEKAKGEKNEQLSKVLQWHWALLAACRAQGIPSVFDQIEKQQASQANIPDGLQEMLEEMNRPARASDMPRRIELCQQALKMISKETNSEIWAALQHELANSLTLNPIGNRAENLELAISHFQQALEVYTKENLPLQWVATENNLANAYWNRIRGEWADNLEQAIFHFQQTLEVLTLENFPQDWAITENNLGLAYLGRIRGERAGNLEQAIFHFQQALEVYSREKFPEDWAQTMNNLANAHVDRIRGERADNLELAISHFQQALDVRTLEKFPEDWAKTVNNLAIAYAQRIQGERAGNLELAIFHFQQALEVYSREKFPEDWATTQNNLGLAYKNRIRGERSDNIEQAIEHFQKVLEVKTRENFPQDWAGTENNLATAYSDRTPFLADGERADNIELAIFHYRKALEVRTHKAFPNECRQTARNLGNLAFDDRRWQLVGEAFSEALAAQEVLMQASFSRSGKQSELREIQDIPSKAAYALLQLGEAEQAVEMLERARGQLLREALERQRRDLEKLPKLGFGSLYDDYLQASRRYEELQLESPRPVDWSAQMETAYLKIQAAAAAIREEAGLAHPKYKYFMQALPFAEIRKEAEQKSLVYLMTTSYGGWALVVSTLGVTKVSLSLLTDKALRGRLEGYLRAYLEGSTAWFESLDEITHWLWDIAMGKLIATLKQGSSSVTLLPAGLLSLLPLHTAWTEDASRPTGRRYALDELNISYAPSAHALWQAGLAADRPVEKLMAVDNPRADDSLLRLIFSEDEVQGAMEVFQKPIHLYGADARLEVVKKEMQKANVLHFSTHGTAGWQEAEQACLLMADGNLTLPDIFSLHLDQVRLAVLSACETGVPGLELIDEMIGLPAGMMQAGVPGVIGSLWSVNEQSTALLMKRFYSLWKKEGKAPQQALRQAQLWLRDRVIDHPYYWAAFTYTGV